MIKEIPFSIALEWETSTMISTSGGALTGIEGCKDLEFWELIVSLNKIIWSIGYILFDLELFLHATARFYHFEIAKVVVGIQIIYLEVMKEKW